MRYTSFCKGIANPMQRPCNAVAGKLHKQQTHTPNQNNFAAILYGVVCIGDHPFRILMLNG